MVGESNHFAVQQSFSHQMDVLDDHVHNDASSFSELTRASRRHFAT